MVAIDADRYQALVAALKNSIDTSVPFATLQDAHARASRARVDLETFQERGAVGQRGQRRHPDLETTYQQSVSELEQRLAAADRDVKRIEALQRQSAAHRANLQRLLDGVKKWAGDAGVALPSDGDVHDMTGFAAATVRIVTPLAAAERSWP
jgi:uncharacterized small protein (DUF1192 family)